jgi:hypothetical protein
VTGKATGRSSYPRRRRARIYKGKLNGDVKEIMAHVQAVSVVRQLKNWIYFSDLGNQEEKA